ncbi:MAG: YhcH/YjgK/YiaL family protein [Abditibacteriaceae bacterium]
MIYDKLENIAVYSALHPLFPKAFEGLLHMDWDQLPCGRHDIMGDDIFVSLAEYQTVFPDQGVWEAHRRYIDIQLIVAGEEQMGHAFNSSLQIKESYDTTNDVEFYSGTGQLITFSKNTFAIYYPHDVHSPGLISGAPGTVRKAVAKVLL